MIRSAEARMSVTRTFNGELYHIIEFPFEKKGDAITLANKRKKEYPSGKQKVVPSKNKTYWGVYEKVSWDHMPKEHRYPKK